MIQASVAREYPWRVHMALVAAGLLGIALIVPYQIALMPPLPAPLPMVVLAALVQGAIMLFVAVWLGLMAAGRVGLGAPILEAWLYGGDVRGAIRAARLPLAIVVGIAVTFVVLGLEIFVFRPAVPELSALQTGVPERWRGVLASVYGGLTEELLSRLFLMSVVAWVASLVMPRGVAIAMAIVVAAVLFGLAHLPATAAVLPLTPAVVTRAVALNGVAGLAFGWLYWKQGLEAAMVAHVCADLVLHGVFGA